MNKKIVSGIDEFVKTAAERCTNLGKIIQQLPIPRENKSELSVMLENSKSYLKSKYKSPLCSETEETIIYCTVFGLSQSNGPFYSQLCTHMHDVFCKGIEHRLISSMH